MRQILVGIIILVMVAVGVSSGHEVPKIPAVKVPTHAAQSIPRVHKATVDAPSTEERRQQVIDLSVKTFPELQKDDQKAIGKLVDSICPFFESGRTLRDYEKITDKSDLDRDMAGYVASITTQNLCPQYLLIWPMENI